MTLPYTSPRVCCPRAYPWSAARWYGRALPCSRAPRFRRIDPDEASQCWPAPAAPIDSRVRGPLSLAAVLAPRSQLPYKVLMFGGCIGGAIMLYFKPDKRYFTVA